MNLGSKLYIHILCCFICVCIALLVGMLGAPVAYVSALLSVLCFPVSGSQLSLNIVAGNDSQIVHLFSNSTAAQIGEAELSKAFDLAYGYFEKTFDASAYSHFMQEFGQGVQRYRDSDAYAAYTLYPDRPHCDKGSLSGSAVAANHVSGMAAFPGGPVKQVFGFDASKSMLDLSSSAKGPAAAGLVSPMSLATQSLGMGAGLVQSIIAAVIHIVPPLIPPPVWNNMPLPCAPMVTGHNCFGAVLYPITMADFVIADVTDSMLDGVIAGFPNTYASKVGKTSDAMYKACFASYMSMQCSSIFPRCTAPQSRDEPIPVGGRVPLCLHLCIIPLVMCPGFWIGDIIGTCTMVSVPPMCTQAFFWNLFRLPPQYTTFDDANPYPKECPKSDVGEAGMDASENPSLYDSSAASASPILEAASTVVKLPPMA
jgi:hypothetical protein